MKKCLLTLIALSVLVQLISAQDKITLRSNHDLRKAKKNAPPKKGDIMLLAVPTIGYNPSYGFMAGAGSTISFFTGNPQTTSISSGLVSVSLTTKDQLIFSAKSLVYTENNNWILSGDWRYLDSSQPTYGLGTGPASSKLASNGFEYEDNLFSAPIHGAQVMNFSQIRFFETVSIRVKEHLFIGLGYHLDVFKKIDDHLVDFDAVPPVVTSNYAYNMKYGISQNKNTLSGFSLNATFDSRDNQNSAYSGRYMNISFRVNPQFLGSSKNSTMFWIEYRNYLDLTHNHRNMLCFWGIGNFVTSGVVPYLDLPAISEDQYAKTGRGYAQGRFRGQNLVYGEAEYRRHLMSVKNDPDFLGFVLFANAFTASNKDAGTNLFRYINMGTGAGLRIMISKKARTNLVLDYGIGNYGSSGFYLKLNETF